MKKAILIVLGLMMGSMCFAQDGVAPAATASDSNMACIEDGICYYLSTRSAHSGLRGIDEILSSYQFLCEADDCVLSNDVSAEFNKDGFVDFAEKIKNMGGIIVEVDNVPHSNPNSPIIFPEKENIKISFRVLSPQSIGFNIFNFYYSYRTDKEFNDMLNVLKSKGYEILYVSGVAFEEDDDQLVRSVVFKTDKKLPEEKGVIAQAWDYIFGSDKEDSYRQYLDLCDLAYNNGLDVSKIDTFMQDNCEFYWSSNDEELFYCIQDTPKFLNRMRTLEENINGCSDVKEDIPSSDPLVDRYFGDDLGKIEKDGLVYSMFCSKEKVYRSDSDRNNFDCVLSCDVHYLSAK
jgi:hypothetical protein